MPFSPSLLRTGVYLILIMLLFLPGMKNSVAQFIKFQNEKKDKMINTPVTGLSIICIGIGIITFIQLLVVPEAHVLNEISYYDYFVLQFILATIFIITGLMGLINLKLINKKIRNLPFSTIN